MRFPQRDSVGDLEWPIGLTPDQRQLRECELHGLPGCLQRAKELLPRAWRCRLANAEVWRKSCWKAPLLIIGRKGHLQRRLQSDKGVGWLWCQPKSGLPKSVGERPEGRQGHLKRRAVPPDLRQHGQRLAKLCAWQEGVEQGDM